MGSGTGHLERIPGETGLRDAWYIVLASMQMQESNLSLLSELSLKGWTVDANAFLDIKQLAPTTIPLRPADFLWPWGDAAKAGRQLHEWQKELGGDVVHLIVPDRSQPKENPWLAAPVLRSWLSLNEPVVLLKFKHDETQDSEVRKSYRCAIIARTGKPPEALAAETHE